MSYLLTFGVALASAFVPFVNIEAYLLALTTTMEPTAWSMAIAAAAGQIFGKLVLFMAARGAVSSKVLRRYRRAADEPSRWQRWLDQLARHPRSAIAVVGISAFLGIPPLLAVSILAGSSTRMSPLTFTAVGFVGRWGRFFAVLAAPALILR